MKVWIEGPLHPDLFSEEDTPIMMEVEVDASNVEVVYFEREQNVRRCETD